MDRCRSTIQFSLPQAIYGINRGYFLRGKHLPSIREEPHDVLFGWFIFTWDNFSPSRYSGKGILPFLWNSREIRAYFERSSIVSIRIFNFRILWRIFHSVSKTQFFSIILLYQRLDAFCQMVLYFDKKRNILILISNLATLNWFSII